MPGSTKKRLPLWDGMFIPTSNRFHEHLVDSSNQFSTIFLISLKRIITTVHDIFNSLFKDNLEIKNFPRMPNFSRSLKFSEPINVNTKMLTRAEALVQCGVDINPGFKLGSFKVQIKLQQSQKKFLTNYDMKQYIHNFFKIQYQFSGKRYFDTMKFTMRYKKHTNIQYCMK